MRSKRLVESDTNPLQSDQGQISTQALQADHELHYFLLENAQVMARDAYGLAHSLPSVELEHVSEGKVTSSLIPVISDTLATWLQRRFDLARPLFFLSNRIPGSAERRIHRLVRFDMNMPQLGIPPIILDDGDRFMRSLHCQAFPRDEVFSSKTIGIHRVFLPPRPKSKKSSNPRSKPSTSAESNPAAVVHS